ncbi:MAG: DUF3365 domain-containing protein, partial [Candidatus Sericytochromatia bacterium]
MRKILLSLTLFSFAFITVAQAEDLYTNIFKTKAQTASKSLLGTLKTQLTEALSDGDTKKAVIVCSSIAQNIAQNVSKENNLYIKRVSLKNRNPLGSPDNFEKETLELFDKMKENGKLTPESDFSDITMENNKKVFRFMKPIVTAKSCLQCHGNPEQIKPEVKETLKEKYPNDIAFGYKEGDVRGAVSIKIN